MEALNHWNQIGILYNEYLSCKLRNNVYALFTECLSNSARVVEARETRIVVSMSVLNIERLIKKESGTKRHLCQVARRWFEEPER